MGYTFVINDGCRVRAEGRYPWPCESEPKRTIELFADDVLTRMPGTRDHYMKHTGLGCFGIVLRPDQVEPLPGPANLRML